MSDEEAVTSTSTRDELIDAALEAGRAVGAAAVFFHSTVAEHLGLGGTDVKTIDLVQRHGPMTPKALSQMTGLAPASVTAILDRLGSKGLLKRVAHPDDGRRLLVELDPTALEKLEPLYRGLGDAMEEILSSYDDHDLQLITGALWEMAKRQQEAAGEL